MANTVNSIWKKIQRLGPNECWPWLGYRNGENGYGRIDILGRAGVYAHRVAYLSANPGSITLDARDGIFVLHKCDNPPCCNPKHLYLGDHDRNMRDKAERNRVKDMRGERGPRAKLTAEDVFWIRVQKRYGATKKALAMLYEVSEATISGACYGRHYQDVA